MEKKIQLLYKFGGVQKFGGSQVSGMCQDAIIEVLEEVAKVKTPVKKETRGRKVKSKTDVDKDGVMADKDADDHDASVQ